MSRAAPRSWSQPPGLILQSFSNQVLSSINILSRLSPGLASYSIKGSGEHSYSLLSPSFLAFEEPTSNEQRPLVALIAGTAVRLERLYILHVYQNGSLTLHWLGKLVQATLSGGQTSAVGHVLGPRNLTLLPTISISLLPWDMDYGNRVHGRMASLDSDHDMTMLSRRPSAPMPRGHRLSRRKESIQHSHPRPPLTPNTTSMPQSMANPLLASAPASPPTPAPSPTPHQRSPTSWHLAIDDIQDPTLEEARNIFCGMDTAAKENWLRSLVEACDNHSLSFLHRIVSPRLKKDPFKALPNELCFRILEFVDDPKTFVRASQVSRRWREIVSDDQAWKTLCEKHAYRRMSSDSIGSSFNNSSTSASQILYSQHIRSTSPSRLLENMSAIDEDSESIAALRHSSFGIGSRKHSRRLRPSSTHRSHFKHRYLVESAWRKGGLMTARHITPDQGVVTGLHLTKKYIIVALDNAKIHVFNTRGDHQRTLQGHVMGVWAMVPWDDMLVSGGCDRDVRVWNMATGASVHTLRGHTSTVRCLKMSDANTAISGSRDTTLRVWDLTTGTCTNVLMGHQASVRCLEICGDLIVSGSYDTTAKIWSLSTGQCLRTLQGHFSQIYAIAFDGRRIATGSLDTSVRIWNPQDGTCQAILQGHTSLVGQLQMSHDTLVTGGSDGSVRVWSLISNSPIHRLAAHDNSVTSLQFDDARIVSGGSDGRVKIWDTNTGGLIRELSQPAEAVWRVAFENERCVVMASRGGRTIMEVWDFTPPPEDDGQMGERERPAERKLGVGQRNDEDMIDALEEDLDEKSDMFEAYGTGGEDSEDMTD